MEKQDEQLKDSIKSLAQIEMENDELKNDIRQMGFMVEDLEQKLDSQLEINELLTTEQEEQKEHMEEQIERLRQQLQDNQTEIDVKDKEIKKLKFNQLIADTQFSGPNQNTRQTEPPRHRTNTVANLADFKTGEQQPKSFFEEAGEKEINELQEKGARHTDIDTSTSPAF